MFYVTKADGRRQPFSRSKVLRTCKRMHATKEVAKAVADTVEAKAYDGIPTKQILKIIFTELKKYKPEIAFQIDLREAIASMRPKPDFEQFIVLMLKAEGYEVESNQIIAGRCVEHEIDAIARKGRDVVCVEVKHHYNHHAYTGLGVFLEAWASFEDLRAGYRDGKHKYRFNKLLVVCNTKISEHAKRYAKCKGFEYLAWRAPKRSLEQIVESYRLYPITFLKGLDMQAIARLGDANIITIRQFVAEDANRIAKLLRMSKGKVLELIDRANKLLS